MSYNDDDSETSDLGVGARYEKTIYNYADSDSERDSDSDDHYYADAPLEPSVMLIGLKQKDLKGLVAGGQITVSNVDGFTLREKLLKLTGLFVPFVLLSAVKGAQTQVAQRDALTRVTTMAVIVNTSLRGVSSAISALLRFVNLLPRYVRKDKDPNKRLSGIFSFEIIDLLERGDPPRLVTKESHAAFLKAPPPTTRWAKLKAKVKGPQSSISRLASKNYAPINRDLFNFLNAFAAIGQSEAQKIRSQLWGMYMLSYYVLTAEGDMGLATQAIDYADALSLDVAGFVSGGGDTEGN